MSTQIILGSNTGAPSSTEANWVNLFATRSSGGSWLAVANKESMRDICGVAGILSNFTLRLDNTPTLGDRWIFEVLVNDVACGIELNVFPGMRWAQDNVHTKILAVGDTITIRSTPGSVALSPVPRPSFSYVFTPTTANRIWLGGGPVIDSNLAGTRQYQAILGGGSWKTTYNTGDSITIIPIATTLNDFYVTLNAAPGVGKTREFSIYLNGAQIAASIINISGDSVSGSVTGMGQALVAGDLLSLSHQVTAGPATTGLPRWSVRIDATNDGESMIAGVTGNGYGIVGGMNIIGFSGTDQGYVTLTFGPTKNFAIIPKCVRLSNLYIATPFAAPGANITDYFSLGKSSTTYPYSASKRDLWSGYLPVTISGASATTGNNTADIVDYLPGEQLYLTWQVNPSRANANNCWGCRITIPTSPTFISI